MSCTIRYHIDHRSACLFSCPLPGSSGWIAGVGLGWLDNSSAASGSSGPVGMVGLVGPCQNFLFLFRFFFLARCIYFHAQSSLPLCLLCFFVLFHTCCSHEQLRERTNLQKLNYNNNSNTAYSFYFNCSSELQF